MIEKFPGHIHVHSEYSLLDGLGSIEEYVDRSIWSGFEFMAITEHGNLFSCYEAGEIEEDRNFKIIKGCEFYYQAYGNYKTGHLILLAKNKEGLRDLFELNAKATENFYYKPRVSPTVLKEIGSRGNTICCTACIANLIHQAIKAGNVNDAIFEYDFLKEVFGDDLYLELQTSTREDEIHAYREFIKLFPNEKFILTGDVHYPYPEDKEVHEVLLSINTKIKMDSPKKMKMEDTYHMMSGEEMYERFMNNFNDKNLWNYCCRNLREINEKCEDGVMMEYTKALPSFNGWSNEKSTDVLKMFINNGVRNKLQPKGEYNEYFKNDLIHELDVISSEGYSGYFLIVNEYCNWARNNGIKVGDGRGSGAGSKVAYAIGITDVNPQKYDLLFERFLAPGRTPDFDVDFSDIDAVFRHLQDKYGKDNVARVGAITRFSQSTAIQKVMSAYNYSYTETKKCMDDPQYYEGVARKDENVAHAVSRLIGKIDHMSTHAGGVVICEDLTKKLPVFIRSEDKEKLIIGLDKIAIESLGHYKFDILGLSGLEVLSAIEERTEVDWSKIDFNNRDVYDMLCRGEVDGVFQLAGQRDKVIEQQPKCFEDIIALNALIRPGVADWGTYLEARKNDEFNQEFPYLGCTHGLLVYQEQYEQLAQSLCGWSIAFGDKHLRKNKDILNDEELKRKFIDDGIKNGWGVHYLESKWDEITEVVSKGYSFNKSHATAYAVLSFKTAYYKLFYPKEFYSAVITKNMNDPGRVAHYISVAKRAGIKFIKPTFDNLTYRYEPCEEGIQIPMTALKGVGESAVNEIERILPIKSFDDMMARRQKSKLKKNNIVALINAGLFTESKRECYEELGEEYIEYPDYLVEYKCFGFYIDHSPFNEIYTKKVEHGAFKTIMQISKITKRKDRRKQEYAFINFFNNIDSFEGVCFAYVWKTHKGLNEGDIVMVEGTFDGNKAKIDGMRKVM